MADRKQTPDVLAELLGGDLPTGDSPARAPSSPGVPVSVPATKRGLGSKPQPRPQPERAGPAERWEVEIVSFQEHRGWRPRYVNGVELKDWLSGPLVHDYVNIVGVEGWELAGGTAKDRFYGTSDGLQLYFKRLKR